MTIAWHPGQLLFVGFDGLTPPDGLLEKISAGRIGGVILFARNIETPAQVRSLSQNLHRHAPQDLPLLLAIDQEGGPVQRLRAPWTEWPPMRALGENDDTTGTRQTAGAIAQELIDCGIYLNFAPVVDVDSNPANPIIGNRSFSRDPEKVARHARAFIQTLQEKGVAACAKHFPGHGDTDCDSHLELPRLNHDLERLRRIELKPFLAAIEAGVASIMTAHILFPQLDAHRPATLSGPILRILREEFGYNRVIFSDDLEMKAMANHFSIEKQLSGCLEAGVDGLLICQDPELIDKALCVLEDLPEALFHAPRQRLARLKAEYAKRWPKPDDAAPAGPPYPAHQKLARHLDRGNGHRSG